MTPISEHFWSHQSSPPSPSPPMHTDLSPDVFVLNGHSFPNDPDLNLRVVAKRYRPATTNHDGVTLLLFHAIGCHKELWEPTITRLFSVQRPRPRHRNRIREVWAFDRENHGDSAVLNREALKAWPACLPITEWASTVADFVKSRLHDHRVVAVGHSSGAGVAMLTAKYASSSSPYARIQFTATITVEPTILTRDIFMETYEERIKGIRKTEEMTARRRDTWASREEALTSLRTRLPWSSWDERVLRRYIQYGLIETDHRQHNGTVTLKCPKILEAACYPDVDGLFDSAEAFEELCRDMPVHIIWGGQHDFASFSPQLKRALVTDRRVPASVSTVPDAGHMVPLQQPDRLADTLSAILDTIRIPYTPMTQAKL
ncbi:alpha/beta-hydrolase [Moniliophthora roreri]|uniref:AB hydrolase-1 domain-containing protein n=1 Tax=Moniliophthora roreri TaxID=221103 RepID=A0A0W0FUT5_MONRR|nr:alpha/beta-hydrolase [Moniliophthora roreri]